MRLRELKSVLRERRKQTVKEKKIESFIVERTLVQNGNKQTLALWLIELLTEPKSLVEI